MKLRLAALALLIALPALADERINTAPTDREMTPAEWRRRQLAAADKSEEVMRRAQKLPGLLAQYTLMQTTYDGNNDRAFRLIFGQYLSWFLTWTGDYVGARNAFSIAQPKQADDAPSPLDGNWHAVPAFDAILKLTKDRKAVFFNEAHSAPVTRTLTVELLAKLREQGFDTFAAETLYPKEIAQLKRGYPTDKIGFYSNEPIYGEMIRAAMKLGYKVVAYDAEEAASDANGDPRERGGAQALYDQVFKRDPNARLVVNAGFAHIQKSGVYLRGSSMAKFFKQITGIDPLCIEQTMLIEHGRSEQDHPYWRAAMQAPHPDKPFVYVDADDKPWTLKPGLYDASVFFPAESLVQNRPTWVGLDGMRLPYDVSADYCHKQFPCLIEARYADEGDDAVAADRVVLNLIDPSVPPDQRLLANHVITQSRLYLGPGNYKLIATDRSGRVLANSALVIKAKAP
jgi:hypothetical protein